MSDYSLGTAQGTVRIDYDGKGIKDANSGMDDLASRARNVQQRFQNVATTTGIAAAAIAGGIGLAVNAAIDFEQRLSGIQAVSGATTDQMELLRKKALQLGADTAFSASESAMAMEELVKAGLSVEDVLNGAADATVALAAAGEIDLPQAAAIASNAMNQFNLAASDLPHIADLIAGAANASAIDVGEFGLSMSQAGAVANLVGLNFEDMATAIALMGNAGIKGSDAGTSLKTMLQNLQPTTAKQIDLMKELGLMTEDGTNKFFDQEGHLKSLSEVAGLLNGALKDSTDAQKAMALETLFGTDAIRAAAIIANEGADGFNEMAAALGSISAKDVAAARLDNVAGALEQLKGSAETAAIAFGTTLLPVIRKVAEFITTLTNKFAALDPRWQKLIAFAAVAVAGILLLISVIAGIVAAVAGVIAAFSAVAGVLPVIGAVIGIVLAVAAAIALLWAKSQAFRDAVVNGWSAIQGIFKRLVAAVTPLVKWIRDELVPAVKEGAKQFIDKLKPAFEAISKLIETKVIPFFQKIADAIDRAMPQIIGIANFLKSVFLVTWQAIGAVLGFVIPILMQVAGILIDVLGGAIVFIISFIRELYNFLHALVTGIIAFGKAIADAAVAVWDFFANLPERIKAFVVGAAEWIATDGKNLILGFLTGIIAKAVDVWTWLTELPGRILAFFLNAATWLVTKGKDILTGFWNGVKQVYEDVKQWFIDLPGKVLTALGDLSTKLKESGKALIQGFWDGIKSKWNEMKSWVTNAMSGLRDLWPFSPAKTGPFSGKGWVLYSGRALMEGFAEGMADRAGSVRDSAERALAGVAANLPTDFAATVSASQMTTGLNEGFAFRGGNPPTSTTQTSHTEININVPLEDLRTITDVKDLLDFVDRLRNDSRRGIEEEVSV